MPRVTTAYISRFQRSRVHRSRHVRGDAFTLTADANGALESGATVASVVFRVDNPGAVIFGSASIDDRSASVECTAGVGFAQVKAEITSSDGDVVTQLFEISVQDAPYFAGESAPTAGATSASA